MRKLYLQDLEGKKESEIKEHLANNYAGDVSGFDSDGRPEENDIKKVMEILKEFNIIIAYESVGDYGCDSSSFFLLKNKSDNSLFEIHGSHCSCYGFEGQFRLEETNIEYLKSEKFNFYCGGYDENETENQKLVKKFIKMYV